MGILNKRKLINDINVLNDKNIKLFTNSED